MMKAQYAVTVVEINSIAGEEVRCHVKVWTGKTLTAARAWADDRWNGYPPAGSRIIYLRDGTTYDIPARQP